MIPAPNSFSSIDDLYNGSVLIIDKPLQWTSFDVVNKIKHFVTKKLPVPLDAGQKRKFKIGHAGTLDPLATGMLVICTGKMTKQIAQIQDGQKRYTGTIFFGKTTPSFDLETEPVGDYPTIHLNADVLHETALGFVGEQLQRPPVFSAKWINGERAYESARRGEMVEMRRSLVEIFSFQLTSIELPEVGFDVNVSKGTYIRSLAHDFGGRLNTGSYLSSLRRVSCAPYSETDMTTLDANLARLAGLSDEPVV